MKNLLKIIMIILTFSILNACTDDSCEYKEPDCGGSASRPMVDLIVLVDTSGSMGVFASQLSSEAQAGIDAALATCNSDLRVVYLGLDGTIGSGNFNTSHRTYLNALPGAPFTLEADQPHVGFLQEQGANAVEDLSNFFDWRPNACRSIFYVSDEELDSIMPTADVANEDAVTAAAIATAISNSVTVFSHYITRQGRGPTILQNYTDLTTQTGGSLITSNGNALPANYYVDNNVFENIICNACNGCN